MKDCPEHAGQQNEGNRSPLDHVMRKLPENQAGTGRHKWPYCAYRRGYRQALADVRAVGALDRGERLSAGSASSDCLRLRILGTGGGTVPGAGSPSPKSVLPI